MADLSALTRGFQQGAGFMQDFRAQRQLERMRHQALEAGEYDLEAQREMRRIRDPKSTEMLGELDPNTVQDFEALEDPFAFRMMDWFRSKFARLRRRPRRAIEVGPEPVPMSAPPEEATAYPYPDYADGGEVSEDEKVKQRAKQYRERTPGRVERATKNVRGANRIAASKRAALNLDEKAGKFMHRAPKGASRLRRAGSAITRGGALGALAGTAMRAADTPTEQYRKRFALETDDPSLLGDIGVRALGVASDLGDALTFGAAGKMFYRDLQDEETPAEAPPETALPTEEATPVPTSGSRFMGGSSSALPTARQPQPEIINFADIDIDPREVPDMKTDDWRMYRARLVDAARRSGRPELVERVNDMVTRMQQNGFLNYAQQGLALMQAGNSRGAMAALRAAYQYFPNGYDVEFGIHKGRIVAFGRDEQTGEMAKGHRPMVMDPERLATLIENFRNPSAFRAWTTDWRNFQQEQRKYEEVTKPLAQAQADYMATNSAANVGLRAGMGTQAANMRNAERVFRERVALMGVDDEAQADFLASVMSQVQAANPQVPVNTIVMAVMQAHRDGTLEQRLKRMGVGAPSLVHLVE